MGIRLIVILLEVRLIVISLEKQLILDSDISLEIPVIMLDTIKYITDSYTISDTGDSNTMVDSETNIWR